MHPTFRLPRPLPAARDLYEMLKPGIVLGNLVSYAGAYALGAGVAFSPRILLQGALAVALWIASGCVLNNLIDRDIDQHMRRTRSRALAAGRVAPAVAGILAALLWLGGAGLLAGGIGPGTGAAALVMAVGYVDYVVVYSLHAKRRSVHGTLVGSVAGAAAPVAGHALGAGQLDLGTLLVFLLFACWQMPHAYAIAVGRMDDYAAAGIPVLPRLRGMAVTRRWSLFYLVAFFLLGVVASAQSSAPALSGAAVGLVGGHWLFTALRPIEADPQAWARGVFRGSLWTVLALALAWSAAPWMAWLGGGG